VIKLSIHQEEIEIINISAPNSRTPTFMRQNLKELRREIDYSTVVTRNTETPPLIMDMTNRATGKQKTTLKRSVDYFTQEPQDAHCSQTYMSVL
jgi:hypothetical protein